MIKFIRNCILILGLAVAFLTSASSASAAIYWNHIDDSNGEQIARANLDGSNLDSDFIAFPKVENQSYLVCEGIAVDTSHIYWSEYAAHAIGRANLDGSEANPWFITGIDAPCGLAIDSSHIYWVSADYANYYEGAIGRAMLNGTNVQPEFLKANPLPCGLTSFDSELFGPRLDPDGKSVGIYRTAANGSGVPELFVPNAEAGCGVAVAGEYIYWTDFDGFIGRASLDGVQVEPSFIPDLVRPCGLAVHDGVLYWSEQPEIGNSGAISRANSDGSNLQLGIVPNLRFPCGVAVDDTPVPPQPEPSNQLVRLSISAVRHLRRSGAILVAVNVSAAGSLDIHAPRQFHVRVLGGSTQVPAGRSWLRISLSPGSVNSWPRDALRRNKTVRFTLVIGVIPASGRTVVRARKLQMWR